jgi:hypothetical protein
VPYVYAVNASELTAWGVTSAGWTPLWASTPAQGYAYNGSAWTTSSTVSTMTASSVVSDFPTLVAGSLLLPVYVAGTDCSGGKGWYDFFDLATGAFPNSLPLTLNSAAITADLYVGLGAAYTPSITQTSTGISLNPGSQGTTTPQKPLVSKGSLAAKPISWRLR